MIRRAGGTAEFVHVDVGDEDGVRDMVGFTVRISADLTMRTTMPGS